MAVKYWHPWALRRPMREIAARYPVIYQRVGRIVQARGFDCSIHADRSEPRRVMLAILAAMPPHVIPYGSMGDDTPWGSIDWEPFLDDLES